VASGSDDKTVRIFNLEDGTCQKVLKGHSDMVFAVAWSPDGKMLASGSRDDSVKLWSPETGACLNTLDGHS